MAVKKPEKIPYQEYQRLKDKSSRKKFHPAFYPWPVLIGLLIPLCIFILAMLWYFMNIKNFLD
jgi:hypothetical protein